MHKRLMSILILICANAALAGTPKDTLVVALDSKPLNTDPRTIGADALSQYLEELRFLPLISFDEKGIPVGVLAQRWEAISAVQWKIKIRPGIKFASGKDVTVEDVVATYNFIRDNKSNPFSSRHFAFAGVKEVIKISDTEVLFNLSKPDAAFINNLIIGVLPAPALSNPPEKVNNIGLESGPYVLKKNDDSEWLLETNENYSYEKLGSVKPKIKNVKFRVITDATELYDELVKENIDVVQNSIDPEKFLSWQKGLKNKYTFSTGTALNTNYFAMNLQDPIFKNEKVRKSIALALNREDLMRYVIAGMGEPATGMFPSFFPFHAPLAGTEHNLEAAKKLLDEAGYPDPDGDKPKTRFKFAIKVTHHRERIVTAKAIAAQLRLAGILVEVQVLEPTNFNKQINEGNAQAWIAPWTGFKDPDHLRFIFHSKMTPPEGANRGFYANAKVDALLEKGQRMTLPARRFPFYSEAQKILANDLPYIYLWHRLNQSVVSKKVNSFKLYSDGRFTVLPELSK